jgi:hypothetical protein
MTRLTDCPVGRQATRTFLVLVVLSLSACGKNNNLHSTTGTVLYKGEPAVGAIVYFNLKGADPMTAHTASAVVGADGTYALATSNLGEGAAPGEYTVLIRWPVEGAKDGGRAAPKSTASSDRLKGKYFAPSKPLLGATIATGRNVIPTFELTD